MNRENLLNFLVFCSFSYKNTEKAIDEENFINYLDDELDYKLSQFIESTLKNKVNQYNKSILLKCIYANYLYNERFKYNKAFLIILSLYEDIFQKKIPSNLSQEFFIYRLKRNLETNSINLKNQRHDKNVELSTYYQVNNLLLLILKNSEMYYEFWNILFNYSQHKDILSLENLGNIINIQVEQIHELFKSLSQKKLNNKKIILLYIYFLRDILNDYEMSNTIMEKEKIFENEFDDVLNNIIGGNNKVYGLNEIEANSNLQFIISSGLKHNSVGFIEKISYDFSKKLGYNSNELIGKNINILLPDFLKENHEKMMIKKFTTYKFKEEFNSPKKVQGLFYMKSNSMYLVPVYMETFLIFDEDYNPHSFTKLENEKEVFFHQKLYNTCHVATNKKFLIQNFTPNSIQLLNLTDRDFNGTVDITFYLKEFCEDCTEFYNNRRENFNEEIIKNILIRKNYFLKQEQNEYIMKNVITWKKNNKTFNLYCEEIRMNEELLGYYFHFEKIEKNNSSSNEKFEINLNDKKFHKIIPKQKSSSCIFISNSFGTEFENGEFKISSEIIPRKEQIINFDFKKHSYVLKDKKLFNENKNKNDIQFFINRYYSKTNLESEYDLNANSIDYSDENENNSSNISSYSDYSSSFSSENEDENEKVNDLIINKNKKKNFIHKQSNKIDYYKVNLKKITFYYYNFSKNIIEEIPNIVNECKIEKILNDKTKTNFIFPFRRDSKMINLKKPKVNIINNSFDKKYEKDKGIKNEEIITNTTKSKINGSIYFLIFSIFVTFFFSLIFTASLILYSLYSKKITFILLNSINCLNNLHNNIGETFYYSVKLTLVQNKKYINLSPSNDEIKVISRNYLNSIYKEMIDLLDSLYSSLITYSKDIQKKIDNYTVNLSIITDQGYEIKIAVPVLNILEEYSTLIFQYANKKDSEINLLDKTFNNLLRNSENFLNGYFYEYTQLFLDEYKLRINRHKIITYCFSLILIPFEIFGLFLILKANFKVSSEKEKFIKYFFQIDKKTIETSLKLCKHFMEVSNFSNHSIKYLISAPKINLEVLNKSEFSEESNNKFFSNINYYPEINNKTLQSRNEKKKKEDEEDSIEYSDENDNDNLKMNNENKLNTNTNFLKYEKKAFNYIFFYIVFFGFFTLLGVLITFLINRNYEYIKENQDLYSSTEKFKLFIMRNVIFFRIFIAYKSAFTEYLFIHELSNNLNNIFETIFENSTKYSSEIYSKVNKTFLSSQTKRFYYNIQKNSLCNYLNEYIYNYGGDCDIIGNGIVHFGIISLSMYIIHSLMHLYNQLLIYNELSFEKGFLYSELFYGTQYYIDLTPSDQSKIEEYLNLDPFNLFNTKVMNYLIVLNDYVFKPCCTDATILILDDINNIGNYIKKLLIWLMFLYISLFLLFTIFYIIPNIIRKNMNINKKRKMLMIIPKNILFEIIMKNK